MITIIKVESSEFLKVLNQTSYYQRPEYRRLENELNTSVSEVFLLPDLLSECVSCEIKVNQNFKAYIIFIKLVDYLAQVVWIKTPSYL